MMYPSYVAKKVGDEYVIVRVDSAGTSMRVAAAAAGVALLGYAAGRRGTWAALLSIGGAALAYHGWTGRNLVSRVLASDRPRHGDKNSTPSHREREDADNSPVQIPSDEVEEALMESFPASDPPASSVRNRSSNS